MAPEPRPKPKRAAPLSIVKSPTANPKDRAGPAPALVAPVGDTACAHVVWRRGGQLYLTVVAKGTFAIVPNGVMTPAPPEPVVTAEAHHGNNPLRSVRATSELAPYLRRADVLLTGHACAPEGTTVEAMWVRLAIFRGAMLLDKTVLVCDEAPFERIPLVYERAYGGIGCEDNPLGVGIEAGGERRAPNLVDPGDATRPACFAPISKAWPVRKRLLGGLSRRALEGPVAEIPPAFDWTYFQAAPADQRIDYLQGGEWVLLQGMHPAMQQVRSAVPQARAMARIHGLPTAPEGQPLALAADTLRIDADAMTCSIVWRGSLTVADEATLAKLFVLVGIELPGRPLVWPEVPRPPVRPGVPVGDGLATVMLDEADAAPIVPAEPPGSGAPASAPEAHPYEGTLALDPEQQVRAAERAVAPFVGKQPGAAAHVPPPPPPPAATASVPELARESPPRPSRTPPPGSTDPLSGTMTLDPTEKAPPSMPFARGHRGRPARTPPPPPVARVLPDTEPLPAPTITEAPPEEAPEPERRRAPTVHALGIEVREAAPLAVECVPWGLRPSRGCLAVIAKATCDLVPGAPAEPRAAAEPLCGELLIEEGGASLCAYPSDLAPFKVRADVVLFGHACAGGEPAPIVDAALRLGGEDGLVRRIRVFGARVWEKGLAGLRPSAPEPFSRMPLRYDLAYGGPGFDANPAGMGHRSPNRRAREALALPHLEDPDRLLRTPNQSAPPACFAAVPFAWKERWAAAGRQREPWPLLPEEHDWTHHQVAPREQQVALLRGDEPFALEGVHASGPVEGTLPGLRARCFAAWKPDAGGRFEEIAMRLDTVVFDTDAMTVSLVWRGVVPVSDERDPGIAALLFHAEPLDGEGLSLAEARARL